MKKVLLITSGVVHPPLWGRITLHKFLTELKDYSFHHRSSLEKLPAELETFSALVLHFHHKRISEDAFKRFSGFVRNGGGVLAIHAATASFKRTLPYFEILGGRFIGHDRVQMIRVRQVRDDIFETAHEFAVKDELYIHELQPGIEVHFTTMHADKEIPVVWTYQYGKGKVCYAMPGHTSGSMRNPAYHSILKRGLKWVTE